MDNPLLIIAFLRRKHYFSDQISKDNIRDAKFVMKGTEKPPHFRLFPDLYCLCIKQFRGHLSQGVSSFAEQYFALLKIWILGSVSFDGNRDFSDFFKYPPFPGKVPVVVHKMFIGMPYGNPVHDGNKSND